MPRLFASSGTPVAEGKGVSHGVQTPMGEVRFTASDDGREIATGHPERWRVGDNAWLERWESSGLELERLTCKIAPELPPGMRVDGCWGVMWRFLADQEIARFTAAARLAAPGPRGSGDTGQFLVALEFETDTWQMHIGTQDADALAERAGDGTLPARWWRDRLEETTGRRMPAQKRPWGQPPVRVGRRGGMSRCGPVAWWREFTAILSDIKDAIRPPRYPEDTFAVEIDPDGVSVSLPPLTPGDRGELQFLVAWVARRDADDVNADDASTWFAVERDPREILGQAGCT